MLHEARAMISGTKKRALVVLGALLLLGVPACLQSTADPGSELNPQPLPPEDPGDKNGSETNAPTAGGASSSSGGGGDLSDADAGAGDAAADGQGD
jgi:hypothetical protein